MAQLYILSGEARSDSGLVLDGAEVTIRVGAEEGGAIADIFEDEAGSTPKANPFTVGTDGSFSLYLHPGTYRVEGISEADSGVQVTNVAPGVIYVDTIADLQALPVGGLVENQQAQPSGYYAPGDGGGGPPRVWKTGAVGEYVDNGGSIIVPTSGDGSGAWVWEWSGAVNVKDFGAVGDGLTDDYMRFRKAMDHCRDEGKGLLFIPSGRYYISQELEADFRGKIFGERGTLWDQDASGTVLRFPEGTNGIRICRGATSTSGGAGDDTQLENIELICVGPNRNSTGHGIVMDARGFCTDVSVRDFPEDGFHIEATASNSGRNANLWSVLRCTATRNGRDGFFIRGADVNAGWSVGLNATSNGRFNLYENSFLGNTHVGAHSDSPARRAYGEGSDGKGYRCKTDHVSTEDTIPVTGATWQDYWEEWAPTTSYATIVAGTKYYDSRDGLTGNYPFYHYCAPGGNDVSGFVGCYAEGARGEVGGGSYINNRSMIMGGLLGSVEPEYSGLAARLNITPMRSTTKSSNTEVTVETVTGGRANILRAYTFEASDTGAMWALDYDETNKRWYHRANNNNSNRSYILNDVGNIAGRTPGFIDFSSLGVGIGGARHQGRSSLPTSGDYKRGDIIWNTSPSAGGKIGWVCTVAGVAGTDAVFKEFGVIDA